MHTLRSSQNIFFCFELGTDGRTNKRGVQQRSSRYVKMTVMMKSCLYVISCNPPNEIIIRVLWTGKIIIVLMLKDQQQLSFWRWSQRCWTEGNIGTWPLYYLWMPWSCFCYGHGSDVQLLHSYISDCWQRLCFLVQLSFFLRVKWQKKGWNWV